MVKPPPDTRADMWRARAVAVAILAGAVGIAIGATLFRDCFEVCRPTTWTWVASVGLGAGGALSGLLPLLAVARKIEALEHK